MKNKSILNIIFIILILSAIFVGYKIHTSSEKYFVSKFEEQNNWGKNIEILEFKKVGITNKNDRKLILAKVDESFQYYMFDKEQDNQIMMGTRLTHPCNYDLSSTTYDDTGNQFYFIVCVTDFKLLPVSKVILTSKDSKYEIPLLKEDNKNYIFQCNLIDENVNEFILQLRSGDASIVFLDENNNDITKKFEETMGV